MMRLSPTLALALALSAAFGPSSPAAGQTTGAAGVVSRDSLECGDGRISFVFIDNHSIFDTTDPSLDERFEWAYGLANSLHIRTRDEVIRRELLFARGECLDPFLLEESERILRAYDFLSHVDVFAVPQPDGSQHVIVDTQDEWSTQVDLRVGFENGLAFEGVRLREANLLGRGQQVGVFYIERDVTRDYGVSYATPQILGTRWDLWGAAGRTRAGTFFQQGVEYPFVGEVGRHAFRQAFHREDRHFDYLLGRMSGAGAHVLLPLREKSFDVAYIRRFGRRGRMTLLGGAVGYESLSFPGGAAAIEFCEGGYDRCEALTDEALREPVLRHVEELESLRGFLLLGQRNVWWVERRGLDSMRGEQDVRLGAEAALAIGRSLPGIDDDDDIYGTFSFYGALASRGALTVARIRADARRDFEAPADASEWEDLFAEGELLAYWTGWPRQTLVFRAHGAGGWQTRVPFQLTLGGDRALRGYDVERFPGGRRVVLTAEDRVYFGWPLPDVLDLGGTVFADAGRVWAGDVPFGQRSGWRASVGVGLRASFPAGGRTTYRLDVAIPVERGPGWKDLRIILSIGELRGLTSGFGDPQLLRSRQTSVSGNLFHFPE